jgi:pyrroline-5-carboxylate reductase
MAQTGPVIGILGVGELAGFILRGAAGAGYSFLLSPRNAKMAETLAGRFGDTVAQSNQDLVDRADMVLVCLPAKTGAKVLAELRFRPGQTVLSAMAGVGHGALQDIVTPAKVFCTMMPGYANALGLGPCLLYPDNAPWRQFLARLGPVHVFERADQFEVASVFGAFSGASIGFMSAIIDWFSHQGFDAKTARQLVAETLLGNAEVLRRVDDPLPEILAGVVTPGGISELCLDALNEGRAIEQWSVAMNCVLARLKA